MTLSNAELEGHDPLAQSFVRHLRALVSPNAFEEVAVNRQGREPVLVVRVIAATPAVGDVLVVSNGNELTTYIGEHTHHHTGVYLFGDAADPKAIDAAALAEAQWLRDLVADRIIVWSRRGKGGEADAGGTAVDGDDRSVEHRMMRLLATEAWYWSGRAFALSRGKRDA